MVKIEQKKAAKKFSEAWKGRGYEKGESQKFWLDLLAHVYGVEDFNNYIQFEDQVHLDHTSFIDGYIPSMKIMIEQKSLGKDLRAPIKQSDGSLLTPFQQAKRYITNLPLSKHPRYVITSNFESFLIYDMEQPNGEPEEVLLENLEKEYYRLSILVDSENAHIKKELEVSINAGEIVGKLYDAFKKQYKNPESEKTLKSLNMLCVRIVFCLYAEDAGIFASKSMFHDFLNSYNTENMRDGLLKLFKILDTKEEDRDPEEKPSLLAFPYVNGGLFTEEDLSIPQFNEDIRELLLEDASANFDWTPISPTIFGAVFESTLNPETRRAGGMHYTSIENIHKVIDPLFLNDLKEELEEIISIKVKNTRNSKLEEFQNKLGSLKFLDPACGSGNFLTETYLSLRRLENKCLEYLLGGNENQSVLFKDAFVKVHIQQLYGIEINDFACVVAKTALWIAECQMLEETNSITHSPINFLPLDNYTNIIEGNALQIDWEEIVPKNELNYIMGNPPFVGSKYSTTEQKKDMDIVFNGIKTNYRTLDYVSCWFVKSAIYIKDTTIRVALVSTNSITQGEQVAIMWKPLFNNFNIKFDFAYKTFRWDSEANIKAHVHCIIIGFSSNKTITKKIIFLNNTQYIIANNINGYLLNAPNIFIESRNKLLCSALPMIAPNKPCDYNNLKIEPEEYEIFKTKCPNSLKWIKKMVGAQEYLKNKTRYCLWLVNCSPKELSTMPMVMNRVKKCREARIKANTEESLRLANTPTLFREQINPDKYLIIPGVSSENRRYVPIGFLNGDTIPVMGTLIIPEATIYHFGILTSNVHMAWMRAVCGRLEMRYRYSKDVVYNNFPWCNPTKEQKEKIEATAQAILDARAKYPASSLADLYNEILMPPELRKAHQDNDRAVMQAYGFSLKMTESECVAELFKLYEKLVKNV